MHESTVVESMPVEIVSAVYCICQYRQSLFAERKVRYIAEV
ncbi:hypothetical protein [Thermoplasma sp.]|nr:hypothetical protein [Thermoplasma sp.]